MAKENKEDKKKESKSSKKKTNKNTKKSQKKENKKSSKDKKDKEEKQPTQQMSKQDKQLRNFILVLAGIAIMVWVFFVIFNSSTEYVHEGVEFKTVREGDLIVYRTLLPLYKPNGDKAVDYRFYLRNHPKEIDDIPIPEELELRKFVIFNYTDDALCEGRGSIALANLKQLYSVMGADIKDESNTNKSNITCDEQGRYNYINIKKGDETKIEKIGPACYEMTFSDCEILEVTERYMLKMFVQAKDKNIPVGNIR